jgi:hypothetical protein
VPATPPWTSALWRSRGLRRRVLVHA